MITQYFDINQRLIIQSPGTLAPASSTPWVYGDNYNLAIYLTAAGIIQPIGPNDTLGLMLFQPGGTLPEANLAIIGPISVLTDPAGFQYYLVNVNLKTVPLAALVQTPNQPAKCEFHYLFTPADGERFSSSADLAITVNPDPTVGASGATPVPPSYPSNPNVFEQIANKAVPNGYASLDATGKVPVAELPTSTAGGDMLKSVYDTNNNGIVDTCDTIVSSRVTGLGTVAVKNAPALGVNATTAQAVMGDDTRLSDTRIPIAHQATHNGGTDAIPLASVTGQGLCPPVDGTTVQVVSGKLIATTTGNGDMLKSVFVIGSPTNANTVDNALAVQTHQVPAAGNASGAQLVLATDTRLIDARLPQPHESTHLTSGSDPIALATTATAGLCPPPDGSSIIITGGKLTSTSVGVGQHGARRYNSANIAITTAGSVQALTFDTEVLGFPDTDGYYSAGKFTVPSGQAGYYAVGANIVWAAVSGLTYVMLAIEVNGNAAAFPVFNQQAGSATAGTFGAGTGQSISGVIHLNAGDYIQIVATAVITATINAVGSASPNAYLLRIS